MNNDCGSARQCSGVGGRRLCGGALVALLVGCASPQASPVLPYAPASAATAQVAATAAPETSPLLAQWLHFQEQALQWPMAERLATESSLARAPATPFNQLQRAFLLSGSQDRQALLRAHTLLDHAMLLLNDPALVAWAKMLAEQVRLRLDSAAQLEALQGRAAAQQKALNDSRLEQQRLRDKLDALADIERALVVQPPAAEVLPEVQP